ncbi:hypothetical protein DIURU_001545 [Diutina rugosa]|uniref:Uncharacterized protein n=1 Tax=Diutina rugosa TaxID=5481 RepID=A0A642UTN7_DIURU|nr:uncharacterized protein DIURU_001545 [Diutina rugosa]KAA8905117.1 hypothetical protein DIURU_001545 [Diutina rugosa]
MQFKTVAVLTVASLAIAAPSAVADDAANGAVYGGQGGVQGGAQGQGGVQGGVQGGSQGGSGTTVVQEEQGGQQQGPALNNPLGPAGAIAAAIWGCFTGWLGTA